LIFRGAFRFTITETVTFDLGGVGFTRSNVGAGAFSLPGRTTRDCSANFSSFGEFDLEPVDVDMVDHLLALTLVVRDFGTNDF
jgi:hypothetical protein